LREGTSGEEEPWLSCPVRASEPAPGHAHSTRDLTRRALVDKSDVTFDRPQNRPYCCGQQNRPSAFAGVGSDARSMLGIGMHTCGTWLNRGLRKTAEAVSKGARSTSRTGGLGHRRDATRDDTGRAISCHLFACLLATPAARSTRAPRALAAALKPLRPQVWPGVIAEKMDHRWDYSGES